MMRKPTSSFLFLVLAVSFLFASSSAALADDDPPGRVARLNYIQGSVSFQPGGESDWVPANPNRPLTTGDNLWTDKNSRGELHIGSTAIRLSSETGISFLNLNDRTVQIQLAQGSMSIRLRRLDGGDAFEIDTPNLAFTVQRPGEYRFDVDPNGQTTNITVREGEGEATGGGSNFHMDSGEGARVSGTDSLTFDVGHAERPDGFDGWCSSRDDREEHAQSARYVSRDVIGYEDLDDYGEWRSVPEYGTVWFPARVSQGWAPYRFGHWIWIEPWGWTWVEDEPWGFAPFHYGRWAVVDEGWCWVPGPVVVRPVYAPALVAFVGGPRFNLSISIGGGGGGVAWFPLGPREVYVPAYRASPRYVQNVNVTNTTVNVTNVTNVYNNVNVNNVTYMHQNNVSAVTAVSHDTFVNARPVAASNVRVSPQQLRAAEIQRGVAVAPVRQSIVGAAAPSAVRPSETIMKRQVVVKEAPPAPPVSFERQKQALSAQPGRVPAQQQMDQLRAPQVQQQQPAVKIAPPARGNQNPSQPGNVPAQQQMGQQRGQQIQQQPPSGKFTFGRGNQNPSQPGNVPAQQQTDQPRGSQVQQQPPSGKFIPPARGNQSPSQPVTVPAQQQMDQPRGTQMQQQPPAGKFTPPARGNQNPSQPGNVPAQQQMDQPHGSQVQQQPPAGKFAPSARGNQNPSQPERVPPQQQTDQLRKPQEPQQPPVKFAPPARVNEDTYRPHQFERPQGAAPPKAQSVPEKAPERGQNSGQERGQEPSKPAAGDSERKQH